MHISTIRDRFRTRFGREPLLVRSPARFNLIGEHTDYNQGFVLPGAIDRCIGFAIADRDDGRCRIVAADIDDEHSFALDDILACEKTWANYLLGVVSRFRATGHEIRGFDCLFSGDIPLGAGLSSSAALTAGLGFALSRSQNLSVDRLELARIAQESEHTFVGVNCGIMDPFANLFGKADHVIKLDCRSLEYEYLPLPSRDCPMMLCQTGVSHELAGSLYNLRRQQCEQGVRELDQRRGGLSSLRDVSAAMLAESGGELDPVVKRRCSFVVAENERLQHVCTDLVRGDFSAVGRRLLESHNGLKDEYEVSCSELDYLVDLSQEHEACLGARMMGGGFGGCSLHVLQPDSSADFTRWMKKGFEKRFGRELECIPVRILGRTSTVE